MENRIFKAVRDGWFDYWVCKRCGHKQQLTTDDEPLPDSCPECGYGLNIKTQNKEEKIVKYKCPICGKTYDKAAELAECVVKCENELNKSTEEKEKFIQAITAKYDELKQLIEQFNKTYPDTPVSVKLTYEEHSNKNTKINKKDKKSFTDLNDFLDRSSWEDVLETFLNNFDKK